MIGFGEENEQLVFEGDDTHFAEQYGGDKPDWHVKIVRRGGKYIYIAGNVEEELTEARHPNMPVDGLSLALVQRIGRPDNYFLILPNMVEVYTNCEYGGCNHKRDIIGRCCNDVPEPRT